MGITHDFNNILNVAMGYISLLLKDTRDNESYQKKLREVNLALNHMAKLLSSLVDLASSEAVTKYPLSLTSIIQDNEHLIKRAAGKNQLDIQLEDVPEISANDSLIVSVLINLIKNASQATPNNDLICLSIRKQVIKNTLSLSSTEIYPGIYVVVSVKDSGEGISAASLKNLFTPYYSTKKLKNSSAKGHGLGLSSVHSTVNKLGGYIDVESQKGIGSTFKLYFPAILNEKSNNYQHGSIYSKEMSTILFVDDEKDILDIYRDLLEGYGYNIYVASNGKSALKTFIENKENIDIVITDVTMPYMDGVDLIKSIIKIRDDIKMLLCTGNSLEEKLKNNQLIKDYKIEIIQKPIRIETLIAAIESLFSFAKKDCHDQKD